MAKASGGIRFEDIIAGQQRLAAQGDPKAAAQAKLFESMAKNAEAQLEVSKQSRLIQAAEVIESDNTRREEKEMHDDIKTGLVDTSGTGLNSNIIKLIKEVKKTAAKILPRDAGKFAPENRGKLSGELMSEASRYVRGPGDVIADAKRNFKEKYSPANLLGLNQGTGILATIFQKKRARDQYVKDQQSMGNTADPKEIRKQFNKVNALRKTMSTDVAERNRLKGEGYSEEQIDRTGVNARIMRTQTFMREADPLLAERNPVEGQSAVGNLVGRDATDGGLADGVTGAESEVALENAQMMETQTETLIKIEENTRGLADALKGMLGKAPTPAAEEKGGFSLADLGRGALRKGGGLLARGASALGRVARFAAPALGIAAAGTAAYQGISDLSEGKTVESAGEVVPEGFNKLNPFAWAMRGGMYAGNKINQGYGAVSSTLGGSGSLGGDIFDGVQKAKSTFTMDNLKKVGSNLATAVIPGAGILKQGLAMGSELLTKPSVASPAVDYRSLGQRVDLPRVGAPTPKAADALYNKSADVKSADGAKASKQAPVVVSAPTTINKTTQMQTSTPPTRNPESSISTFLKSRY